MEQPAHLLHLLPRQDGAQRHEAVRPIMQGQCQASDADPGAQAPLTELLTRVHVCRPQNNRLISENLLGPGQQQSNTQSQLLCPLLHPGPRPSRLAVLWATNGLRVAF